ncbi:GntR family transcriptional regulator [Mangrovicoccus ximenensis]|uniref:GntR family transcriptional regulator n=1 Tax=Mangrovicoccus ximenensis TaxID=1911570 RepID=UPI000D33A796
MEDASPPENRGDSLAAQIRSLSQEGPLPPERQLAEQLGVNRYVLRKALRDLRAGREIPSSRPRNAGRGRSGLDAAVEARPALHEQPLRPEGGQEQFDVIERRARPVDGTAFGTGHPDPVSGGDRNAGMAGSGQCGAGLPVHGGGRGGQQRHGGAQDERDRAYQIGQTHGSLQSSNSALAKRAPVCAALKGIPVASRIKRIRIT